MTTNDSNYSNREIVKRTKIELKRTTNDSNYSNREIVKRIKIELNRTTNYPKFSNRNTPPTFVEKRRGISVITPLSIRRGAGGEAGCGLGVRPYVAGCDTVAPIVYSNGRTIIPLVGEESCRVAVWLLIVRA